MSKRKGRFGGMLPIDTLSTSESRKDPIPTRYTTFRKDPKVVHKLNHLSTLDFLTADPTSAKNSSAASGHKKYHSKSRAISVDSEDETSRKSDIIATPIRKRQKGGTGVVLSSPSEHDRMPLANTSSSSGTLRVLDAASNEAVKSHCVLRIVTDSEGIRCSIRWKGSELDGSQIDFLIDCERFYFDTAKMYMGILLKHNRRININEVGEPLNCRIIVWTSDFELDKNLILIKKTIMNSFVKVEVVPDKREILPRMKQVAQRNQNDAKNRKFWEKPEFQSLGRGARSKRKFEDSGTKIRIPNDGRTTDNQDLSTAHRNPFTITTNSFYAENNKSGPSKNEISLKGHALSSLRRSQRFTSPSNAEEDSLDEPRTLEEPEEFKPHLFYRFEDGSTFSVTNLDFKCLYNHDWINDSILDFFVKFWAEESVKKDVVTRNEVHVLSSFFYTKLVSDPSDYYSNIKKWISNTDLFTKKYVVMPINVSFHWFGCIIINLPSILDFLRKEKELLEMNEVSATVRGTEDNDEISITPPVVSILVYDSLRQTHSREVEPIKEFLIAYALDKYGLTLPKGIIKMKTCMVPQQPNMSDCGVHVILNTRKFFQDPSMTTEMWRSTKSKGKPNSKMINEYFEKNARDHARKDLRKVLRALQEEQIESNKLNGVAQGVDELAVKEDDEEPSDIEIIEDIKFYEEKANERQPEYPHDGKEEAPLKDMESLVHGTESTAVAAAKADDISSKSKPDDLGETNDTQRENKSIITSRRFLESSPFHENSPDRNSSKKDTNASGTVSKYFNGNDARKSDKKVSEEIRPLANRTVSVQDLSSGDESKYDSQKRLKIRSISPVFHISSSSLPETIEGTRPFYRKRDEKAGGESNASYALKKYSPNSTAVTKISQNKNRGDYDFQLVGLNTLINGKQAEIKFPQREEIQDEIIHPQAIEGAVGSPGGTIAEKGGLIKKENISRTEGTMQEHSDIQNFTGADPSDNESIEFEEVGNCESEFALSSSCI